MLWQHRKQAETMAKKKKIKRLDAVQMVKEMARERIGAPPLPRVVPDKKRTQLQQKHRPRLNDLQDEDK
jgi:hypothetical protein